MSQIRQILSSIKTWISSHTPSFSDVRSLFKVKHVETTQAEAPRAAASIGKSHTSEARSKQLSERETVQATNITESEHIKDARIQLPNDTATKKKLKDSIETGERKADLEQLTQLKTLSDKPKTLTEYIHDEINALHNALENAKDVFSKTDPDSIPTSIYEDNLNTPFQNRNFPFLNAYRSVTNNPRATISDFLEFFNNPAPDKTIQEKFFNKVFGDFVKQQYHMVKSEGQWIPMK